jgi:signal transduction histidine kinase
MLDLGVRGPLTPPQAADVRRIHLAYEHLTRVVDDLLSYSRLVGGKLQLDVVDVPVARTLAAAGELLGPQAVAARVALEIDPGDSAIVARADADRLRQIVLNLTGNALKFTPAGGRVRVCCHADEAIVYIEVVDNGGGIPIADREAVFQPFVRSRTPTGASGTGLGLAISRDLARAMGGDVSLERADGTGSRFVLRLQRSIPLAPAKPER